MIKTFCFLLIAFFSSQVFGQDDSTKHLFKPGTLVGKYYGTYDTSAKKNAEALNTRKVAGLEQVINTNEQTTNSSVVAPKPQLQVNRNFDPIEVSGTEKAGQISVSDNIDQTRPADKTVSGRTSLQINRNFDPIEVSGTTEASQIKTTSGISSGNLNASSVSDQTSLQKTIQQPVSLPVAPSAPYRDTRLGSSAPMYNTYRTNDNGAGAITTAPKDGSVPLSGISPETTTPVGNGTSVAKPFYRDTRLGSSSPDYNTYRTNDDGAGAVTTSPKNGSAPLSSASLGTLTSTSRQPATKPFYRDTRLGSSSPDYNTYRTNDNGAGAVTTNPNKGGGGVILPSTAIISPEQAPTDSTTSATPIRSAEKRTDNTQR